MIFLDNPDYFIFDGVVSKDKQVYLYNDEKYKVGGLMFANLDKTILHNNSIAYYKSKMQGKTITRKAFFIYNDVATVRDFIYDVNSWLGKTKPKKLTFSDDLNKYCWARIINDVVWDIEVQENNTVLGMADITFEMPIFAYAIDETVKNAKLQDSHISVDYTLNSDINNITISNENYATLKKLEGVSQQVVKASDLDVASWKVNETIKNELIYENYIPKVVEKVNKITFNGSEPWKLEDDTKINTFLFRLDNVLTNYNDNRNIVSNFAPWSLYTNDFELIGNYSTNPKTFLMRINKSKISSLSGVTDLDKFKTYLFQNNLIVTYQLEVQNPKVRTLVDDDISSIRTSDSLLDFIQIKKPTDFIYYNQSIVAPSSYKLDNYKSHDGVYGMNNVANIGVVLSNQSSAYFFLGVEKGSHTLETARALLRGKKLTYQLASPRFAEINGLLSATNPNVVSVGKNLFNPSAQTDSVWFATKETLVGGVRIIGNNNNSVSYVTIPYTLKPNTDYTMQLTYTVISGNWQVSIRNSKKENIKNYTGTSTTFTTDDSGKGYFYFYANNVVSSGTFTVDYKNIQLEQGKTPTTYEPYKENSLQFNETIRSLPNGVKDVIVGDRITKNIEEVIFKGTEAWACVDSQIFTDTIYFYAHIDAPITKCTPNDTNTALSNLLPQQNVWDYDREGFSCEVYNVNQFRLRVRIKKSKLNGYNDSLTNAEKVNLFKSWLQSNNIKVQYQLATPIERLANYTTNGLKLFPNGTVYNTNSSNVLMPLTLSTTSKVITNDIVTHTSINNQLGYVDRIMGRVGKTIVNPKVRIIGKNLFDKSTIVAGKYFSATGTIADEATSEYSTQYIQVKKGAVYSFNKPVQVCKYDKNKTFIIRDNNFITSYIATDDDFIRVFSYQKGLGYLNDLMMNHGVTVLPHEPFTQHLIEYNETLYENEFIDRLGNITKYYDDKGVLLPSPNVRKAIYSGYNGFELKGNNTIYIEPQSATATLKIGYKDYNTIVDLVCNGNVDITEPKIILNNFTEGILDLTIKHLQTGIVMDLHYPVLPTDEIIIDCESKNVYINGKIDNRYFGGVDFIRLLGKNNFAAQQNQLQFINLSNNAFDIKIRYQDLYL